MKISIASFFAVALAAMTVHAEETTLIFATVNPPNARLSTEFLRPWAERVNEEGKGVLHLDVRDGIALASIFNDYDRVLGDVIQVAFGLHNYVNGKFPLSTIAALPLPYSAEVRSVALWRLYKSGALSAEYDQSIPLFLFGAAQAQLHSPKPIPSPDDWHGLRLIASSKIASDIVELMGGAPISLGTPEMYEGIRRGTADGAIISWTIFDGFKFGEVTNFHFDEPMGGTSGMIFMSRKKYEGLSPAARKILDHNSGEAPSRLFGVWWDHESDRARDVVAAIKSQTVIEPDAAQRARWNEKIAPIIDQWAKRAPNGEQVLAEYRTVLAAVAAGH